MPRIDFTEIKNLIDSSIEFSLSEKQYEKLTGRKMPKDTYYLTNNSAIARFAAELGLRVSVHEKSITFEKNRQVACLKIKSESYG